MDVRVQFEHDRAQLLMDLDTAREACVRNDGVRLKWIAEFHDRLEDLKLQAAHSDAFSEALESLRRRRRQNR